MRFQGRLLRDGRWWLAEVPMFDAMTQGRTRREALAMIKDWFETMAGEDGLELDVRTTGGDTFEIGSANTRVLVSLLLRRQRHRSGLTLAEVSERLGARSRNAYARYEQGASVPTIEKLEQLLRAIAPDREILLTEVDAAQCT